MYTQVCILGLLRYGILITKIVTFLSHYKTFFLALDNKHQSVLEPSDIHVAGTPSISLISNFINCRWTLYKKLDHYFCPFSMK